LGTDNLLVFLRADAATKRWVFRKRFTRFSLAASLKFDTKGRVNTLINQHLVVFDFALNLSNRLLLYQKGSIWSHLSKRIECRLTHLSIAIAIT